ncbi:MAG: hypothetical protein D6753_08140 [Planctomycetota bacterium]|nr:MAG: hypothetical protein D6753_08140 [Planctomycetota bacterium]
MRGGASEPDRMMEFFVGSTCNVVNRLAFLWISFESDKNWSRGSVVLHIDWRTLPPVPAKAMQEQGIVF